MLFRFIYDENFYLINELTDDDIHKLNFAISILLKIVDKYLFDENRKEVKSALIELRSRLIGVK